jgi:large subunit ribosomal protein L24
MKQTIKTGDEVVVIAGNNRGHRGKVLRVIPAKQRVIVEGAAMLTYRERPSADSQSTEVKRVKRESPIHISNIMRAERYDERRQSQQNG